MKLFQVYFALILLEMSEFVSGNVGKKLKYYEVVHSSEIQHEIRKRSVHPRKEMTLSVLGRTFELSLTSKPELFSNQFQAVTVDKNGDEKEFAVNKNDFYHGFVKGEERSSVTLEVDEDMITAAIETKEDTYHVEPAAGKIEGDTENKMIAYRDSDVLWKVTFGNHSQQERYCGIADAGNRSETNHPPSKERDRRSTRRRRAFTTKRVCDLVLVADSLYHEHIGQGNSKKTLYSMVAVINRVDAIFKGTDFSLDSSDPYKGFGFVIKKIIIHEKPTSGYNLVYKPAWKIKALLEEFSREDWSKFCLAHLFTYQDFANGVIGLAYVAHPEENSRGGICSEEDRGMWHNTGLSSSINWGNRLLTTEADIVTAHELGHNFGSEHDVQDNKVCSPAEGEGGKYIMYPASVSGRKRNNNKFSECSRRAIKSVLASKSSFCFDEPEKDTFCGNFRVEKGEECDGGDGTKDKCCTASCKLGTNAKCSDTNSRCCVSCEYASNSTLCAQAQPLLCKEASYCSGKSDVCPPQKNALEGTECIERGKCNNDGTCEPFCKTRGLEPCLCTNDEDACYFCCKNKENGTCSAVYSNSTSKRLPMTDGRLCSAGVCRNQKCEKAAQDIITRLQDFFDTLGDPSKFGEFLKDNIVGTVIVFSLFLWIPVSIIVHRIDKRRDKQAQELARWQDMGNQDLIRQPQKPRDHFDVVFKKDTVLFRDSRKPRGRGVSPRGHRGPTVQ